MFTKSPSSSPEAGLELAVYRSPFTVFCITEEPLADGHIERPHPEPEPSPRLWSLESGSCAPCQCFESLRPMRRRSVPRVVPVEAPHLPSERLNSPAHLRALRRPSVYSICCAPRFRSYPGVRSPDGRQSEIHLQAA